MAFDTLSYARRLKSAGMPEAQAEAVAEATRDVITADVATKADIERLGASTKADIDRLASTKADIDRLGTSTKADIERLEATTKAEFSDVRHEIENVRHEMTTLRTELKNDMAALEARMNAAIDALGLRLTVRLGGLIAVGVAALAAINKL